MTARFRQIAAGGYDPLLRPPFALEAGYPLAWRRAMAAAYANGYSGTRDDAKSILDVAATLNASRAGLADRVLGYYRTGFDRLDANGRSVMAYNAAGVLPSLASTGTVIVAAAAGAPPYWDHASSMSHSGSADVSVLQGRPGIAIVSVYRNPVRSSRRSYPAAVMYQGSSTLVPNIGGGAYLSSVSAKWAVETKGTFSATDAPAVGYGTEDSALNVWKLNVVRADFVNNSRKLIINNVEKVSDSPWSATAETDQPMRFWPSSASHIGLGYGTPSAAANIHVTEAWFVALSGIVQDDTADLAAIGALAMARNPQIA